MPLLPRSFTIQFPVMFVGDSAENHMRMFEYSPFAMAAIELLRSNVNQSGSHEFDCPVQ